MKIDKSVENIKEFKMLSNISRNKIIEDKKKNMYKK